MKYAYRTGFVIIALALSVVSPFARADVFENFESLSVGPLDGQGGWHSAGAATSVGRDYTRGGNRFAQVRSKDTLLYRDLGPLAIDEGDTATLFFRFRPAAATVDHGFGLSDVTTPTAWGSYEATALVYADGSNVKVRGRYWNGYDDLTLNGGASGLSPGEWYDVWMVVDNDADVADFYIQGGSIASQRKVGDDLRFRNGTAGNDLTTFFANVGDSGSGTYVMLDDIHVRPGEDLSTPAAMPQRELDIDGLFDFAGGQLAAEYDEIARTDYPHVTGGGGTWDLRGASSWTSGFFPGQLWQMYERTGETAWRDRAVAQTAGLEGQKTNNGTHDIGFVIHNTFGKQSMLTGDAAAKDVVLTAAETLATRYDPVVGAIRSWGGIDDSDFRVIIDNMMNLEMLFWAARNGGDPNLHGVALQHAYTTREAHVRDGTDGPAGSTFHVVNFDRQTGAILDRYTHQGYADDTTWTRGQAWGMYGFTMTYRESGDANMLQTAQDLADYFIANLPSDWIPPNDFDDPGMPPKDSSAGAVAASALLELMGYVGEEDADRYFAAAEEILLSLAGPGYLSDGTGFESILLEGSERSGGNSHIGTSYGDYYFLEALSRYEAVPEPTALVLLGLGGMGLLRRRR